MRSYDSRHRLHTKGDHALLPGDFGPMVRVWDEVIGGAPRGDVLVVTSLQTLGIDLKRRRRLNAQLLADRYWLLVRRSRATTSSSGAT